MTTPPPTEPDYPLPVLPDAGLAKSPDAEETEESERAIAERRAFEMSVRVNFMTYIRLGATLQQAAAASGCSVRTIHGWLADDPNFRQRYHEARWDAETAPLEHLRQLAPKSVRAAIYLAERERKQALRRSAFHADQPLEYVLARIESSLRTMFSGFATAVHAIEDEEVRKRILSELNQQVEPVATLLRELWQRYEAT